MTEQPARCPGPTADRPAPLGTEFLIRQAARYRPPAAKLFSTDEIRHRLGYQQPRDLRTCPRAGRFGVIWEGYERPSTALVEFVRAAVLRRRRTFR